MKHAKASRPCCASDLILVTGGLQCGNCLVSTVPKMENGCSEIPSDDKPCPIASDDSDGLCWIHRITTTKES